jgi:hypothetical protein
MLAGTRMATLTAIVLFVFLAGTVLGGSITLAAQDSLPGQRLYSLKRLGETTRLSLARDAASRERLQETYNQRRRMETHLLLQQGQTTVVTFVDDVRSVDDSALDLDSLVIHINSETVINGELRPGARVQLEAVTQPPHTLVALTLTVIEPGPVLPTSTATPSPSPTPTLTLTPTPTLTLTPTPTLVVSQGSDSLSLPTPTQTPSIETEDEDTNNNTDDTSENGDGASNHNNDNTQENGNDDENENDDGDSNENDNSNNNDDSNDNSDDDSSPEDDDDDNSGSNSGNSGKGNSDDRDDDDKDDDDK